jgi:hypothetical protein
MVSRFEKPQIGQTRSDSKVGVFTGYSEDGTDSAERQGFITHCNKITKPAKTLAAQFI